MSKVSFVACSLSRAEWRARRARVSYEHTEEKANIDAQPEASAGPRMRSSPASPGGRSFPSGETILALCEGDGVVSERGRARRRRS